MAEMRRRRVRSIAVLLLCLLWAQGSVQAAESDTDKQLSLIHLLVRAGKYDRAAASMRALYPEGPPRGGEMALEYYDVIGNVPDGWVEARAGLERLVQLVPDDMSYRLVLARHLTKRPSAMREGLRMFASLVGRTGIDRQQVLEEWRAAMARIEGSELRVEAYQDYLAVDPDHAPSREALAAAQRAEAERLPWQLRDKADAQLAAGQPAEALATLRQAMRLDPKNAWVRFDLARLLHKQGEQKQGRVVMEDGLSAAVDDADMLYANALYVSLLDEAERALQLLDQIPAAERSASMQRLRQKMLIQAQTQRAQALAQAGNKDEAFRMMEKAVAQAGKDAELLNQVALAWVELGEPERALALLRPLSARAKASIDVHLFYTDLLNRVERDDELATLLTHLESAKGLTAAHRDELRYLRTSLAARRADNLRHAGNLDGARSVLSAALKKDADHPDLLKALARIHTSAQQPQQANEIYRKILQQHPDDTGARLALARSLQDAGDKAVAQQELERVLSNIPADDLETRMSVVDVYIEMNELPRARAIIGQAKRIAPEHPRVLLQSGHIARAEGRYGEAMANYERAQAHEEMAKLKQGRAQGYLTAGLDLVSKIDGTPGISTLVAREKPVELRLPMGYAGGQMFMQVDPVDASAGTLDPADLYGSRQYGKVLALSPAGLLNATQQSAKGTALAAGYEGGGWRFDVGTTPQGFLVSDVVGGIKWSRYTETTGFSLDVSRRPLTSSLLAYAGVRDPVSGEVWGGVRSSGVSMHMSRDRGRQSGFLDLGYYRLNGKNVLDNTQLALRTGFDHYFVDDDGMRMTAGLALTSWQYRENLRYYSFGHGGYYSPQHYTSLALPVRWTGRSDRWSYLLQASVSASLSYEKSMPFYPTDANLQAQGVLNAATMEPVYSGGSGRGSGYSLGAGVEYHLGERWFTGGRVSIDRSAYYTPNFGIVYLRYLFDDHVGAVPFPPEPVKAYSRY